LKSKIEHRKRFYGRFERKTGMSGKISVIIPTKNEGKSIGICIQRIQKVFNEHHIDGEIIVADNSTDNTPKIAKSMRAKVIVQDEHGYGNF